MYLSSKQLATKDDWHQKRLSSRLSHLKRFVYFASRMCQNRQIMEAHKNSLWTSRCWQKVVYSCHERIYGSRSSSGQMWSSCIYMVWSIRSRSMRYSCRSRWRLSVWRKWLFPHSSSTTDSENVHHRCRRNTKLEILGFISQTDFWIHHLVQWWVCWKYPRNWYAEYWDW